MSAHFLAETLKQNVAQALVISVTDSEVMVGFDDDLQDVHPADLLMTSEGSSLRLLPGDIILAWRATDDAKRVIILGRVTTIAAAAAAEPSETDLPESIVLEARDSISLRVGDGSITIRADGKVLIKGKDLVSHAQRTNRIKGGSVAIN